MLDFAIFLRFLARLKIRRPVGARSENGLLAVRPARRALRVFAQVRRPYGGILLRGDEFGHGTSMGRSPIVALFLCIGNSYRITPIIERGAAQEYRATGFPNEQELA
jgi:hypothetical protein